MSGNGKKKQLFLFIHYSPFITIEKKQMFMFKVCRKMCVCVLFNLDCRSKSIWHLKKIFVIHKSAVALCLRLCLFFRTFCRKYAYSCYAYKKKLVYFLPPETYTHVFVSGVRNVSFLKTLRSYQMNDP